MAVTEEQRPVASPIVNELIPINIPLVGTGGLGYEERERDGGASIVRNPTGEAGDGFNRELG